MSLDYDRLQKMQAWHDSEMHGITCNERFIGVEGDVADPRRLELVPGALTFTTDRHRSEYLEPVEIRPLVAEHFEVSGPVLKQLLKNLAMEQRSFMKVILLRDAG
jgi:hypothetical protein